MGRHLTVPIVISNSQYRIARRSMRGGELSPGRSAAYLKDNVIVLLADAVAPGVLHRHGVNEVTVHLQRGVVFLKQLGGVE